jgi:exonuclease VII small subunit
LEETYSNSNDEEQIEHFNKRLQELEENIESLEADL